MRELDDTTLERHLREVLEEHLGTLPLDLTVETLNRRQAARGDPRRFGRGRGMTLLAAAALVGGGALAAGTGILRLPSVVPPVPSPSVVAVATTLPDATSPGPSESTAPTASPIPVAGPGGVWVPVGTMVTPGSGNAVRLLDGRVLVVGSSGGESDPTTAQLYDPGSGTWSATGSMLKPQGGFPPTLLLDGRVLAGHVEERATGPDVSTIGAEVYDPASGTWTATGTMVTGEAVWAADFGSTATALPDGKVLVAGQGGAQVYDPESGTWSATGAMVTPRHSHTATVLRDGTVLVAAGYDGIDRPLGEAELYDPDTGTWTAIASTHFETRNCYCLDGDAWATLQQDGTLLLMRMRHSGNVEIYDPATGTWTTRTELAPTQGGYRTATLLSDGTVLVDGLAIPTEPDRPQQLCSATALYDPQTGSSTTSSSMLHCGNGSSFTLLLDGTVLVAGGGDCLNGECVASGAAELYVPRGVSPPPLPAFPNPDLSAFPSPTPDPTPFPPAAGPVPPNARSWTVTVVNNSSNPTTLFVADETEQGTLGPLVGSVTPNVVPPGTTMEVTFTLPAKGVEGWAIFVNARPDEGSLVGAAEVGIPGKILVGGVGGSGEIGWVSP